MSAITTLRMDEGDVEFTVSLTWYRWDTELANGR